MDDEVSPDDLSPDDQRAVGWAWTTGSPTGAALRARLTAGGTPMTSAELLAARAEWEAAGCPVPERHSHRTAVELPDGSTVTAVSFLAEDPYGRDVAPAFGLYLDERWSPPWPHEHVAWADFGVPDRAEIDAALGRLLVRARRGELVEIGCLGGHGRTGTALACLAVLTGTRPDAAVVWVRDHYCPDAVETDEQRAFVEAYHGT